MKQSLEMAKMIGDAYLVDDYIYAVVKLNGEAVFFENVVDAFDYQYQNKDNFIGKLVQLPIQKTSEHNQQTVSNLCLGGKPVDYNYLINKKIDGPVKLKFDMRTGFSNIASNIWLIALFAEIVAIIAIVWCSSK